MRSRQQAAQSGSPAVTPAAAAPAEKPPAVSAQIKLSPAAEVRTAATTAEADTPGRVTVTVVFDAEVVDPAALRMHLVDLDVEADALVLFVHAEALRDAKSLSGAAVDPVVRVRLPSAIDPDSAIAKYSREKRTLTVTADMAK